MCRCWTVKRSNVLRRPRRNGWTADGMRCALLCGLLTSVCSFNSKLQELKEEARMFQDQFKQPNVRQTTTGECLWMNELKPAWTQTTINGGPDWGGGAPVRSQDFMSFDWEWNDMFSPFEGPCRLAKPVSYNFRCGFTKGSCSCGAIVATASATISPEVGWRGRQSK